MGSLHAFFNQLVLWGLYLVLVCALMELFQLVVEHSELPGDAVYPGVQTPVLTVLGVEIVFIPLPLLRRGDHRVLPGKATGGEVLLVGEKSHRSSQSERKHGLKVTTGTRKHNRQHRGRIHKS